MVQFTGDYSLFTPSSPFSSLIQEAIWRGVGYVTRNGTKGIFTTNGHNELNLQTYLAIASVGVEITGYPIYIKIHDLNYGNITPSYLPNSQILDINNNATQRTWSNWRDSTHYHTQIGEYWYIAGNSFGEELSSSIALLLIGDGYTLVDTATYVSDRGTEEVL